MKATHPHLKRFLSQGLKILIAIVLFVLMALDLRADNVAQERNEQRTPDGWLQVELPQLPDISSANTLNISDYGASEDADDNSEAIQHALDAVPADGGMVVVPAGTFKSGPLRIKSKTILHLNSGAKLQMLAYGLWPAEQQERAFIVNDGDESGSDIIIEGEDNETCIIDGQGEAWWQQYEQNSSLTRPYALICFSQKASQRFLVRNIRLSNAPMYNLKFNAGGIMHATAHDVVIYNPSSTGSDGIKSHNTDGISMSGRNVNIYRCNIYTGDDNIVCKLNASYIHVWDCQIGEGHGVSLGSQTGGINHIIVEDCSFNGGECGFKIKTARDRGGDTSDITVRNCQMNCTRNPLSIYCWYEKHNVWPYDAQEEEITNTTPMIHDILIQNVTINGPTKNATGPIYFYPIHVYGLPESSIKRVVFDNVQASSANDMLLAFCDVWFVNGCKINGKDPAEAIKVCHEADIHTNELPPIEVKPIELSAKTALCQTNATTFSFLNGYTITNDKNRGYATGKNNAVKYKTGTTYTINLPEGVEANKITFNGYSNNDTNNSWLASLNGTSLTATDHSFTAREVGNYAFDTYTFDINASATQPITFNIGGYETALSIELHLKQSTDGIITVRHTPSIDNRYYLPDGHPITQGQLKRGLYIHQGRKYYPVAK